MRLIAIIALALLAGTAAAAEALPKNSTLVSMAGDVEVYQNATMTSVPGAAGMELHYGDIVTVHAGSAQVVDKGCERAVDAAKDYWVGYPDPCAQGFFKRNGWSAKEVVKVVTMAFLPGL